MSPDLTFVSGGFVQPHIAQQSTSPVNLDPRPPTKRSIQPEVVANSLLGVHPAQIELHKNGIKTSVPASCPQEFSKNGRTYPKSPHDRKYYFELNRWVNSSKRITSPWPAKCLSNLSTTAPVVSSRSQSKHSTTDKFMWILLSRVTSCYFKLYHGCKT